MKHNNSNNNNSKINNLFINPSNNLKRGLLLLKLQVQKKVERKNL